VSEKQNVENLKMYFLSAKYDYYVLENLFLKMPIDDLFSNEKINMYGFKRKVYFKTSFPQLIHGIQVLFSFLEKSLKYFILISDYSLSKPYRDMKKGYNHDLNKLLETCEKEKLVYIRNIPEKARKQLNSLRNIPFPNIRYFDNFCEVTFHYDSIVELIKYLDSSLIESMEKFIDNLPAEDYCHFMKDDNSIFIKYIDRDNQTFYSDFKLIIGKEKE